MAKSNGSILLSQQRNPVRHPLLWRRLILAALGILALGTVLAALAAVQRRMYRDNPSLTLRRIETSATGKNHPYAEIIQKLSEMGVETGVLTLPRIPVRRIREKFEEEPLVEEARVTLECPDVLRIHIRERNPVAILKSAPSFCIDEEGIILPRRILGITKTLPSIVGIRTPGKLVEGSRTNDNNILAAVGFLKQTRLRPEGIDYDVNFIQIDNSYRQLRVVLNARSVFRQDSVLVLPIEGMDAALARLRQAVRERQADRRTIGFVDVTFEKNIVMKP